MGLEREGGTVHPNAESLCLMSESFLKEKEGR
jgi:hypothetical protein